MRDTRVQTNAERWTSVKSTPLSHSRTSGASVLLLMTLGLLLIFVSKIAEESRAEQSLAASTVPGSQASRSVSSPPPAVPMPSLDEQVQEIKSDVLAIAAELSNLEERLLYPSNTQVAVFVALAEGDALTLDSVQVQIDGEPAARHIYSFKELSALEKGGVQRLYTGNLQTGEHRLEVTVTGKSAVGQDFTEAKSFSFDKEVDPKLIAITLSAQLSGGASIELGDW